MFRMTFCGCNKKSNYCKLYRYSLDGRAEYGIILSELEIITTRCELRKVLFLALSVRDFFVFI